MPDIFPEDVYIIVFVCVCVCVCVCVYIRYSITVCALRCPKEDACVCVCMCVCVFDPILNETARPHASKTRDFVRAAD
jgi:hypothetical protein